MKVQFAVTMSCYDEERQCLWNITRMPDKYNDVYTIVDKLYTEYIEEDFESYELVSHTDVSESGLLGANVPDYFLQAEIGIANGDMKMDVNGQWEFDIVLMDSHKYKKIYKISMIRIE